MSQRQRISTMLIMVALSWSKLAPAAEQDTVQAVIPWEAEGRVFQVGADEQLFLGALHGILYVESSAGDINEAFVMCPVIQRVDTTTGNSKATAHCEITASGEDVAYAEMSCDGEIGDCKGTFTLTSGVGAFEGITGEGSLRVRSPIGVVLQNMAAGAEVSVSAGLAIIKNLSYRIP